METPSISANRITAAQIDSMDLETAILAVQTDRVNNLETQLKDQVKQVANRNQEISDLNKLMNELRADRPAGTDTTAKKTISPELYKKLEAAGCSNKDSAGNSLVTTVEVNDESKMTAKQLEWVKQPAFLQSFQPLPNDQKNIPKKVTGYTVAQSTFDTWNETLKGKIDSLSSSQQMDMLRLQSLSNKRNEAFELMSTTIKKSSDLREFIINKS